MRRLLMGLLCCAQLAGAQPPSELEEAERLLFAGRLAEAERRLAPMAAARADEPRVLLRLAQAWRWSGRPWAAIRLLQPRAEREPLLREELAAALLDVGRPLSARAALSGQAPSDELQQRLGAAGTVEVTTSAVAFDDSFGAAGLLGSTVFGARVGPDLALRAGVSAQRLGLPQGAVATESAGAEVGLPFGPAELRAGYGLHRAGPALRHEARLGLSVVLTDGVSVAGAVRRRPFLSPVPLLGDGLRAFYGAGSGGAYLRDAVSGRAVDEATLAAAASLGGVGYSYLSARGFAISDGNRGADAAAGLGVDLLAAAGVRGPFALSLRWDSFVLAHQRTTTAYFSPPLLETHAASVEVRYRLGVWLALMAEGGGTGSFSLAGQFGALAGGGLELRSGAFELRARAQWRNDLYFSARRGWAELAIRW